MFSVGSVFPNHGYGGAQKILRDVALYLGKVGHHVTIFCTAHRDNSVSFSLGPNVQVSPTLRLKETYPEPYYTAPYNLSNLILDLRHQLEQADVFYVHGGEFPFYFLHNDIPTVRSFRDFVYPDNLAHGLSMRGNLLILNSDYVAGCVIDTFSTFCPTIAERIRVIPNGFDLNHFRPVNSDRVRDFIALPPDAIPILYPHRSDPRKGIYHAIDAIRGLRDRLGRAGDRLRLLVPGWNNQAGVQDEYEAVRTYAYQRGVADLMVFHPWLGYDFLPAYYSLGRATLCIGNFVEAFGNVHLESIACGTPCIVSRVGAYRSILPDNLVSKVNYGDFQATVDALEQAISRPYETEAAHTFLATQHSYQEMVLQYEQVLTTVKVTPPLSEHYPPPLSESDRLMIPRWCYLTDQVYYNDYEYDYNSDTQLHHLLRQFDGSMSVANLLRSGVTLEQVDNWLRSGLLVREPWAML